MQAEQLLEDSTAQEPKKKNEAADYVLGNIPIITIPPENHNISCICIRM